MSDSDPIITPTRLDLVESLREAVGSVAKERKYLAAVDPFSVAETRSFVEMLLGGGGVQLLALDGDRVVGWCDVTQSPWEGTRHCGTLGMGIVSDYRGRGLGRDLLRRILKAAKQIEIDRIELEVFSSNENAVKFYERWGFEHEGRKRRARIIDGTEADFLIMAKFLPDAETS